MHAYYIIEALCKARGIAITALEKELGFGRGSIGKMKYANSARVDRLQAIADYFDMPLEFITGGNNPAWTDVVYETHLSKDDLDKIAPAPTPPSDVNPPPLTHREMDLLDVFKDLSDRSQRHLLLYALELYKEQESGEK